MLSKRVLLLTVVALAYAAIAQSAAAQAGTASLDEAALAEQFVALCSKPFGDRDAVRSAVAAAPVAMPQVETAGPEAQMGVQFKGENLSVSYIDAPFLPKDLPNPQCHFGIVALDIDFTAFKAALEQRLSLEPAEISGAKKGRPSAKYDIAGPNGTKRRMFVSAGKANNGKPVAAVTLLGLR